MMIRGFTNFIGELMSSVFEVLLHDVYTRLDVVEAVLKPPCRVLGLISDALPHRMAGLGGIEESSKEATHEGCGSRDDKRRLGVHGEDAVCFLKAVPGSIRRSTWVIRVLAIQFPGSVMRRSRYSTLLRTTLRAGMGPVSLVLVVLLCTGCGSTSSMRDTNADVSRIEYDLRSAAADWEGTPHRWGGTSRGGVDCSGLVQSVYADLFDVALPRTTQDQVRVGKKVRSQPRAPGDLIFFKTGARTRHVGMYLGRGEFFHASSSAGVTISRLDAPYWQRTYWMTRRVLPGAASRSPVTSSSPEVPISTPARTGW